MNPDYIVSEFSRTVCAELDQFLVSMIEGKRPVLVLGAPPQHGKSDIVSRYFPAYTFGKFPNLRVGGLSYAKELASDMNLDVQRIMTSEAYSVLFPKSKIGPDPESAIQARQNSTTFGIAGSEFKGSYIGQGVGGPLTGKPLDLGIIDDPIKNSKEALSPTVKDGIWKWYGSTFLTRLSKNSGQIIMATRWATDDLSGKIIENNPNAKVLAFPAIDENGNALVPEMHPLDKLLETKAMVGEYFWAAMYQQSPAPIGGGLFKNDWWRFYKEPPKFKYRAMFADTAQKTGEQNDYTVIQCWGFPGDGSAYLIDQARGKWEAPELLVVARAFWNKHKEIPGVIRSFNIEDKVSGTGLIQTLKRERVPVIGIKRDRDKITRAMDAAPTIESGCVYLPENAPWLSDLMAEAAVFPNGAHDDQLDPLMDAVAHILASKKRSILDVL